MDTQSTEKTTLREDMIAQAVAMASHALRSGVAVPGWALDAIAAADPSETAGDKPRDLLRAHSELARLIKPMTPDLVVTLDHEAGVNDAHQALGPVRIARVFMLLVIGSTLLFIGLSTSHYLKDPKYGDIFTSSGWPLLVNELFFLTAASVGASFSNLFEINRAITSGTFSPGERASYWVRFVLGVVAGLLLATVLRIGTIAPSNAPPQMHFQSAALALMGGFSSSVVQRIVERLTEALESVLKTTTDLETKAREAQHRQELDEMVSKHRMKTSLMLAEVRRRLSAGEDPKVLSGVVAEAGKEVMEEDAS